MIDKAGYIYVTGSSWGINSQYITTIKYDIYGNTIWTLAHPMEYCFAVTGNHIEVDSQGNIIVAGGVIKTSADSLNFLTFKIDAAGNVLWSRVFEQSNVFDWIYGLEVDTFDNVYVVGFSNRTGNCPCRCDVLLLKYDTNGNFQWNSFYDSPSNQEGDFAYDICVDENGCAYLVGKLEGLGTGPHFGILKYSPDGQLVWEKRYLTGRAVSVLYDPAGFVFVGGARNEDFFVVKLDTNGNEIWSASQDGHGGADIIWDMAMDSDKNLFVTGWSTGIDNRFDLLTIKYDSTGHLCWTMAYDGSAEEDYPGDYVDAIVVDEFGDVYITGGTIEIGTSYDLTTIKYTEQVTPVDIIVLMTASIEDLVKSGVRLSLYFLLFLIVIREGRGIGIYFSARFRGRTRFCLEIPSCPRQPGIIIVAGHVTWDCWSPRLSSASQKVSKKG